MSTEREERETRFRALFVRHHDPVLRFARRRTKAETADDVVAETFLVAWRRLEDVPRRPDESLAWLLAVARNSLRTARRTGERQSALAVRIGREPVRPSPGPDPGLRVDLDRAWHRLTAEEQEALALTVWDDLTSSQAGRVLGISPAAYRMRLARARRSLRRHLDPTGHTPAQPSTPRLQEEPR
jgi:RNA polymerase sigma-70 factor (ECF subfamily)